MSGITNGSVSPGKSQHYPFNEGGDRERLIVDSHAGGLHIVGLQVDYRGPTEPTKTRRCDSDHFHQLGVTRGMQQQFVASASSSERGFK